MPSTFTYDNVSGSLREDLLDILTNLSPTDTQLVSGLGVSEAKSIRHEWLIDTLTAAGLNAYAEGVNPSYVATTNPARIVNYTQILQKAISIPGTTVATNNAAMSDRFEYEKIKKLKELKNDLELAILRGSLASGTGTDIRQMRGIKNSLSLVTSQSGVSMTEAMFNAYLNNVWAEASTEVNAVYVGIYMKNKISAFTVGATKNVETTDKRLVGSVDVYESDSASMVKLMKHRHMTINGDTNYDVMGIDENMFKVAYLTGRTPYFVPLAKTGDADNGMILAEATLENLHYNAGFLAKAHL